LRRKPDARAYAQRSQRDERHFHSHTYPPHTLSRLPLGTMPGERFSVRLVPEEGGPSDRVVVEIGMDGFNVVSPDGTRTLRKYPLTNISRWSARGSSLVLFTRSPVSPHEYHSIHFRNLYPTPIMICLSLTFFLFQCRLTSRIDPSLSKAMSTPFDRFWTP
jgi:hypothetical protein